MNLMRRAMGSGVTRPMLRRLLWVCASLLLAGLAAFTVMELQAVRGGNEGGDREQVNAVADDDADGGGSTGAGAGERTTRATWPDPFPSGHEGAAWLGTHGKADLERCSTCHSEKRCTGCHGIELPHPAGWDGTHGPVALAVGVGSCGRCHEDRITECDACHTVEMPHPADWVKTRHRTTAASDVKQCASCHTEQTCASCHDLTSAETCGACHAAQLAALDLEGGHSGDVCLSCHQTTAGAVGPGADHRTTAGCLTCHSRARLAPSPEVVSARQWARSVGQGMGSWIERGVHGAADLENCGSCHDVHNAGPRQFPAGVSPEARDCADSCHSWVRGDVTSRGFVNSSGNAAQTTYQGTIDPTRLLAGGSTLHTTEVYGKDGCAGRCHDGPHGTVTPCVECHDYSWGTPANLHSTHIPFVSGEQAAADPENFGASGGNACMYCHAPGTAQGVPEGSTVYRGSCWNCHLSGHNPITPYWEMPQG